MAASSSSSSSVNLHKYDVFVSFRGEDTRGNFVSYLHNALCDKKINTYVDYRLDKGDEILPSLIKAIEESHISVIIFSENYASSSWCLNELLHILSCKKEMGKVVIPVFYRIDPSNVRKQQSTYATAFKTLGERFPADEVNKWRNALKATADIVGWNSQVFSTEAIFVEAIVKDIVKKLDCRSSSEDYKNLVGLSRRIYKIESLLHTGSQDVRTIGICGLGGIGKTTLSQIVFNRLSSQFEGFMFLESIGQTWEQGKKTEIAEKLYSTLLKEEKTGLTFRDRLRRTRVLIVADDVNDPRQLELLTGVDNKPLDDIFGPGSRIIITSRDKKLLKNLVNDDMIYEVEGLNYDEALELFRLYAFKRNSPTTDGTIVSEKVIQYANGIPLALKVLGSLFNGKSIEIWRSALEKLNEGPDRTIQDVLKISYDGLDRFQKSIFLDIACFFRGNYKDFVERILKHASTVIDDLIDMSLITIMDNKFRMHDLINVMGKEIVLGGPKENKEPGNRSRLWISRDVCHVLETETGTAAVEGIFLDLSEIREVLLSPNSFGKMYNLRLLKIYNLGKCKINLSEDLHSLPNALTYLHWEGYPSKSLPTKFNAASLVELSMPNSQIIKLESEDKLNLSNLKKIDLSYSENLSEISILSQASNIEHIYLEYCVSLTEVPSQFQYLEKLKTLYLEGCSSLKKFPELPKNIICLVLNETAIEEVPSISFECLSHLQVLSMRNCERLLILPTTICKLKSLDSLSLSGCSKLEMFPEILEPMINLRMVQLDKTGIEKLPYSMKNLTGIAHFLTDKSTVMFQRNNCKSEFSKCLNAFLLHTSDKSPGLKTRNVLKESLHEKSCLTIETMSIARSALSQGLDDFQLSGHGFLFYNFLKLPSDIEIADSEDNINSFHKEIDLPKVQRGLLETDFGVCFQENEIPEWFSHQSENSWIRINLNKTSIHSILGFSICVVVDFMDNYSDRQRIKLLCQAHYIRSDGSVLSWDFYKYRDHDEVKRILAFFLESQSHIHPKDGNYLITEALFEFSCVDENHEPLEKCKLKKCGIHPLFAKDKGKIICNSDAFNEKEFEPSGSMPVGSFNAEKNSRTLKIRGHKTKCCKPMEIVSTVAQRLENQKQRTMLLCYNFLEFEGEGLLRSKYYFGEESNPNAKPFDRGTALLEFKREFTTLREEDGGVRGPEIVRLWPFSIDPYNTSAYKIHPKLLLDPNFLGFMVSAVVQFEGKSCSDFKLLCRSRYYMRHLSFVTDWHCCGDLFSSSSSLQDVGKPDRSFNLGHKFRCFLNDYETNNQWSDTTRQHRDMEFELWCVDENYEYREGCKIVECGFQPVYAEDRHLILQAIRESKQGKVDTHELTGCKPLEIVSISSNLLAQRSKNQSRSRGLVCLSFLEFMREEVVHSKYYSGAELNPNAKPFEQGIALLEFKKELALLREEEQELFWVSPKSDSDDDDDDDDYCSSTERISLDCLRNPQFLGFLVVAGVELKEKNCSDFKLLCRFRYDMNNYSFVTDWHCCAEVFSSSTLKDVGEHDRSFNLSHKFRKFLNDYDSSEEEEDMEFEVWCVDENYEHHKECKMVECIFEPVFAKKGHRILQRFRKFLLNPYALMESEAFGSSDLLNSDEEEEDNSESEDFESSDLHERDYPHNLKLLQKEEKDDDGNVVSNHIIYQHHHDRSELILKKLVAANDDMEESKATPFVLKEEQKDNEGIVVFL